MTGVEIGESIVRNLATSIFNSLTESSGKAFNQFSETLQQKIYLASKQYNHSYIERHGTLKVLGMREPIPLESVYVAVQFLDNKEAVKFETIEALEQVYRRSQQRGFYGQGHQTHSGVKVANQKQYLMILGGPGMGKTTFLRKMGLEALKGKQTGAFEHDCIPVFIELKGCRSGSMNLEETIAQIFKIRGFPEPHRFALKALEKGKLLILLDGLDEVRNECMHDIVATIQSFVDRYNKNRYIVSCRLAAYRYNFRRFTDVTISGFSNNQIENFIANWFSSEPEKGQDCWQKLTNYKYAAAKELTHTPLLLTLICLLYQRAGQFPTNRATLYEKALRILLEEWAGEKGIPQESVYRGLDTKRKEIMLAEVAYQAFQEDRFFLYKRELSDQIERLLKEMLPNQRHINGATVLKSIEIQHGILVERAEGIYSFSHLTFQEFLTAQYLVDNYHEVKNLIDRYLIDQRWREIFLLLAGLRRADELLLEMQAQIHLYTSNGKLQALLIWCAQSTAGKGGHSELAAKRAVALFLALNLSQLLTSNTSCVRFLGIAIDYARKIAFELDSHLEFDDVIEIALVQRLHDTASKQEANLDRTVDILIEIAQRLGKTLIFREINFNTLIANLKAMKVRISRSSKLIEKHQLTEQMNQAWLNTLKLRREWFTDLSLEDVSVINSYLYANLLLMQARKAAVRVSSQTWSEICSKLLKFSC